MNTNLQKLSIVAVGAMLTTFGLGSTANALTLSSSSGTWINVNTTDPDLRFQTVGNENQVRWGLPLRPNTQQSGLGFTGVTNRIFDINEVFQVGSLRYFNTVISGPLVLGADLSVNLNFSEPSVNQSFTFNFGIDETPNRLPCRYSGTTVCPDRITFPNAFAPQTFNVGGVDYTLQLIGFSDATGGIIRNDFIGEENTTNQTFLFARITTPPPVTEVPEPVTTTGLGLLGIYFGTRRQRQKVFKAMK